MTILVATTRITIRRRGGSAPLQDPDGAGYGSETDRDDPYTVVASAVRATIIPNSGQSANPGDTEITQYQLACDPADLRHTDLVEDERTGRTYEVAWAHHTLGVAGLDHINAGLSTVDAVGGVTP